MSRPPLPYSPDIEQPSESEQNTIDGIIQGMTQQSQTVEQREHHAVRASHAKSTALAVGTLEVPDGLPAELAQGLFARPGIHPVAVRFAQGPGERRTSSWRAARPFRPARRKDSCETAP